MHGLVSFVINPHSANLLRFTALGVGIFYGAYRYRSLCEYVKQRTERREIEKRIKFADEAKLLYQARLDEKLRIKAEEDGVIADMDSIHYDAEKHINWLIKYVDNTDSGSKKKE